MPSFSSLWAISAPAVLPIPCAEGTGVMTVHPVFPGICLIFNDIRASGCAWQTAAPEGLLEINHCREGREGCRLRSGASLYLGEGDLSIHTMDNCAKSMSFPLGHYRGITVALDLHRIEDDPPGILSDAGLNLAALSETFCAGGKCFVMRAKDSIEHIFSELYAVPDRLQGPYFKLKVQELLLFLSMVDVAQEERRELCTPEQVEIIRSVHRRLTADLTARPTIETLAREHLINSASLKSAFRTIYGQPIGAYMRAYRVRRAAQLLRQTPSSIAEIAAQVGYENQSKFAAAFRSVMHLSPAEYRRQNTAPPPSRPPEGGAARCASSAT